MMNIKYDLRYNPNPDLDELLETLKTAKLEPAMRRALEATYEAMTAPLTALEKTMTSEQLKEAGHPAWARGYTVDYLRLYFIYDETDYHPHGQKTKDVLYDIGNR